METWALLLYCFVIFNSVLTDKLKISFGSDEIPKNNRTIENDPSGNLTVHEMEAGYFTEIEIGRQVDYGL